MQRELDWMRGAGKRALLGLLKHEPMHGYPLMQELLRAEGVTLKGCAGLIYPLLYELEAKGLIRGEWNSGGRNVRRVYCVTKRGERGE